MKRMTVCFAAGWLLASSAPAGWILVDNFEGLSLGDLNGQNGWTATDANYDVATDPTGGVNRVLASLAAVNGTGVSKLLPNSGIADGASGTLFFRFRREGFVNYSVGTANTPAPTASNSFEVFKTQLNIQSNTVMNLRDGGAFQAVDTWQDNTWYSMWMVATNTAGAGGSYSVYLRGGPYAAQTLLDRNTDLGTVFAFRSGNATTPTTDLVSFFARSGGTYGNVYLDDIYLDDTGANLTDPSVIPEPGALALLLPGLLVAWRCRRARR